MAEKSVSKNQQFLQQFERQRLNKPCNRIIDLRGKVAGECQAYTFGGKTHYLDDRAYLLAKQLLDRFNGRYTIGVYEAVLKALKSLSSDDTTSLPPESNKTEVQLFPFDQELQRKEPRIIYATPVEIRIADVLYHGTTMDITSSAISVSLKRTYTLDKDDLVSVNFLKLSTKEKTNLLAKISYSIFKIDHDEHRTQLVLTRDRHDNDELTQWLDKWSQHYSSGESVDLDYELINITTHYYLRLYCRTLNSSLLWLNHLDQANPIKAFQMSAMAEKSLQVFHQKQGGIDLSLLPIEEIISERCDLLLLVTVNKNSVNRYLVRRDQTEEVTNLLHWQNQHSNSQLFLIQANSSSVELANFEQELDLVKEIGSEYFHTLKQRLVDISQLVTVSNITNSCQQLTQENKINEPKQLTENWGGFIPVPAIFRHHIYRDNQRFLIRTSIHIHSPHENRLFKVITTDVSNTGLSISLPGQVDLTVGSHITVDFVRWQSQTKKTNLKRLPYIVRNNHFHSGASHLGLERDIYGCDPEINKFFATILERNKEQLAENNSDVYISQETKIFSSLLAQQLTAIPFYLAMDSDNQRRLQAVSTSHFNQEDNSQLWQAMQNHVLMMSQLLNELPDTPDSSTSFGIYCYQEKSGEWKIQTDLTLTTAAQKILFINQAMRVATQSFYHCTLTPIKPDLIEQEDDLNQKVLQFHSRDAHKVKQLRNTLHSLFAVGELIDITDIIKSNY